MDFAGSHERADHGDAAEDDRHGLRAGLLRFDLGIYRRCAGSGISKQMGTS